MLFTRVRVAVLPRSRASPAPSPARRRLHARTRARSDETGERPSSSSSRGFASADSPEGILRVSKRTSFEGLKAARRVELEKARANGDEKRADEVRWAFDELVKESREFFERACAENDSADARFRLGNFYQTLEKLEEAEREYRRALELGMSVDAANNLAMMLQERGELDEAEAFYLKALEGNESDVDVLFNWATLKLNCRQDLNATRILIERIVTIQPELKKHPLVKALRDDDDDDEAEPFILPI